MGLQASLYKVDCQMPTTMTLQKNRPVPAFLQIAVIDKPIPVLFAGALQRAAIGGL